METSKESLEQRTVKKTMWRLIPYVLIGYIIAYLDRANFGYAALEMNKDLAIGAEVFGILSGIFFIGYLIFEVPSNILLTRFGARVWLARILITWGIVVILTAWAQSVTHLYILRFLLGVAEAGFFPGIVFLLTYWFRNKEQAQVFSLFVMGVPIAAVIGGPLSTWMMDNISWFGMEGWRWMFILQGIPPVIFGIFTLFWLANRPKDAKWLTDEEKTWLEAEIDKEQKAKTGDETTFNKRSV